MCAEYAEGNQPPGSRPYPYCLPGPAGGGTVAVQARVSGHGDGHRPGPGAVHEHDQCPPGKPGGAGEVDGQAGKVNGGVGGASIPVCASNIGQLGVCASSKRYKSDIATYRGGLNVINQLRPVSFTWTEDKIKDVGFVAEELNAVEPRLSIRNKEGVVEGIKYGQITAVIVNAMKEQQAQITKLQAELDALKTRVRLSRNRPRSHK